MGGGATGGGGGMTGCGVTGAGGSTGGGATGGMLGCTAAGGRGLPHSVQKRSCSWKRVPHCAQKSALISPSMILTFVSTLGAGAQGEHSGLSLRLGKAPRATNLTPDRLVRPRRVGTGPSRSR